jgi:hypothetical protein
LVTRPGASKNLSYATDITAGGHLALNLVRGMTNIFTELYLNSILLRVRNTYKDGHGLCLKVFKCTARAS